MESTTGYTCIYPLCGIFYFPWHRHQIEGTNGFYCLIRKTERFTIYNVESQVFTPNNSRLDPDRRNPGCPRDKRMSYHWSNRAPLCDSFWQFTVTHAHTHARTHERTNARTREHTNERSSLLILETVPFSGANELC